MVPVRIETTECYGANVAEVDGTYDEAVDQMREDTQKHGWQIIADTSRSPGVSMSWLGLQQRCFW